MDEALEEVDARIQRWSLELATGWHEARPERWSRAFGYRRQTTEQEVDGRHAPAAEVLHLGEGVGLTTLVVGLDAGAWPIASS